MKVLITLNLNELQLDKIRAVSEEIDLALDRRDESVLSDVEVIFGGFNQELFFACPKLRWVQLWSAGVDEVLFPEFAGSEVILTSAKGYVGTHLAEQAFALLLSLTRGVAQAVRERTWDCKADIRAKCWELVDKTMGIVGLGATGQEVAKRAAAFGMRILAVDPEDMPKPEYIEAVWKTDKFHDLLTESDVVCICAPLTPQTERMFNLEAFKRMKRHALLINVTRGRIVDAPALVQALQEELIGGAGLDVTPEEPLPPDNPLWNMDNVVITPHVAGGSPLRDDRCLELFCENLRRFLHGEPMLSVVDKRKGY